MISPRDKEFSTSPKIGDNISIGIDYRTQFLYSEEMKKTDFQQMSGSIYTNIGIAKTINVLARYDFVNFIWEAYGVAHILPNNSYIKADLKASKNYFITVKTFIGNENMLTRRCFILHNGTEIRFSDKCLSVPQTATTATANEGSGP